MGTFFFFLEPESSLNGQRFQAMPIYNRLSGTLRFAQPTSTG
jgi:hypothetical protein